MAEYIKLEPRYIDINKFSIPKGFFNQDLNVPKIFDLLYSQPSADVVEVVHGTWEIRNFIDNIGYRCSACNLTSDCDTPYCPLCGAKMDGDKNG